MGGEVGHRDVDFGDVQAGQRLNACPHAVPHGLRDGGNRARPAHTDRQLDENDAAIDVGGGLRQLCEAGVA